MDLMKEIISEGVCLNIPDPNPRGFEVSPLHNCVEYDLLEGVPILVDAGANSEHQSFEGLQADSHSSSHCPRQPPNGEDVACSWC